MKSFFLFLTLFFIPVVIHASGAKQSGKPRPPVQVSIKSVQTGLLSEDIRPGDTVELKVTAISLTDAKEMQVEVETPGGAEVVSGEDKWSGPLVKGQEKVLLITVRAPQKGHGMVRAKAVIHLSEDVKFSAVAVYRLGTDLEEKNKPQPEKKKDSKGRDIIEYRVK